MHRLLNVLQMERDKTESNQEKTVNLTKPPQVPDLASAATAAGAGARAAATSAAAA
jgi:hypothetical protein